MTYTIDDVAGQAAGQKTVEPDIDEQSVAGQLVAPPRAGAMGGVPQGADPVDAELSRHSSTSWFAG